MAKKHQVYTLLWLFGRNWLFTALVDRFSQCSSVFVFYMFVVLVRHMNGMSSSRCAKNTLPTYQCCITARRDE